MGVKYAEGLPKRKRTVGGRHVADRSRAIAAVCPNRAAIIAELRDHNLVARNREATRSIKLADESSLGAKRDERFRGQRPRVEADNPIVVCVADIEDVLIALGHVKSDAIRAPDRVCARAIRWRAVAHPKTLHTMVGSIGHVHELVIGGQGQPVWVVCTGDAREMRGENGLRQGLRGQGGSN